MKKIDFEKIKWGALTNQMKRYKAKHPRTDTVEEFAKVVEEHPSRFKAITKKRELFYKNILKK